MALPRYIDEYVPPKSEPRGEGERWNDYDYSNYKQFNSQEKKDFYDLMTPTWSEQVAKQYNKDMEKEDYQKYFIDKYNFPNTSLNGISNKDINDAVNPSHYKGIVPGYEYFDITDYMLEGWEGAEAHALGNGLKYLMRLNKKDNNVQELGKAIWYLNRLKEYLSQNSALPPSVILS